MGNRSIAIVGSGISGLSAAWHLSKDQKVFLFEKDKRIGGHTHTHAFDVHNREILVDSGFIVFNKINYPLFSNWIKELNVGYAESEMSFSVSRESGTLEWGGKNIFSVFCQKKNMFSPNFIKMLFEIPKFNKLAREAIKAPSDDVEERPLGAFLSENNFSKFFFDNYIGPMAGAIWSTPEAKINEFPTLSILHFFDNHGLLSLNNHHQWFHLKNGSSSYIDEMFQHHRFKNRDVKVLKNCSVTRAEPKKVGRGCGKVALEVSNHQNNEKFSLLVDDVVFACHANESLKCLDASRPEATLLKKIRFQKNQGFLHNDSRLMPMKHSAWSSWNYFANSGRMTGQGISVTYWMNKLQSLNTRENIFVSLNPFIDPCDSIFKKEFTYEHPVFDQNMIGARRKLESFQGLDNFWYCGAWTGNGFHEDGFKSGKSIAEKINSK